MPAAQASEQQLAKLWQLAPFCAHIWEPVPHLPLVHAWLQHWAAVLHEVPSGSQLGTGAPQRPFVQDELQHEFELVQAVPSGEHIGAATQLPALQLWLQQPLLAVHADPVAPQVGCPHAPPVHVPLQHWLALEQDPPDARHVGAAHSPAVHVLVQQSLAWAHACPVDRHALAEHTPAVHDMLQQSVYCEHVAPAARHLPGGTGVLVAPESPLVGGWRGVPLSAPPPPPPPPLSPARGLLGADSSALPPAHPPNIANAAATRTTTHACEVKARLDRMAKWYMDLQATPARGDLLARSDAQADSEPAVDRGAGPLGEIVPGRHVRVGPDTERLARPPLDSTEGVHLEAIQ